MDAESVTPIASCSSFSLCSVVSVRLQLLCLPLCFEAWTVKVNGHNLMIRFQMPHNGEALDDFAWQRQDAIFL